MIYILNNKTIIEEELSRLLLAEKELKKSYVAKRYGLHNPVLTFTIVLEGDINGSHLWICDTNVDRVISRAKEYFSFSKTEFTIYINDNYCLYKTLYKRKDE